MDNQIPLTGKNLELTVELKAEIKALIKKAGGARHVAGLCNCSYDTYHNVMRNISSDFDTVQTMVNKAKEIIAQPIKPAVVI